MVGWLVDELVGWAVARLGLHLQVVFVFEWPNRPQLIQADMLGTVVVW